MRKQGEKLKDLLNFLAPEATLKKSCRVWCFGGKTSELSGSAKEENRKSFGMIIEITWWKRPIYF